MSALAILLGYTSPPIPSPSSFCPGPRILITNIEGFFSYCDKLYSADTADGEEDNGTDGAEDTDDPSIEEGESEGEGRSWVKSPCSLFKYLPLLLSLASPPLGVLLPNPLPPALAANPRAKYPFAPLRKALRLLIDDSPRALDEVENDISFVYSGYAPISVRLVQCVAQKGGVLSNPAEKGL
ncbi:hypothetical protein C8R46DRAFT_1044960 [Mycena filopes]|nr:hypothetical protein C8R46DRAFT_1044960 [Mycena filopes]